MSAFNGTTEKASTEADGALLAKAYDLVDNIGYLREDEVRLAIQSSLALHSKDRELQFIEVNHIEPTKEELLAIATSHYSSSSSNNGHPISLTRYAEVISLDLAKNQTIVDRIPLLGNSAENTVEKPVETAQTIVLQDVQPGISPDEYALIEYLCKTYEPLRNAMIKRNLDPEGIVADAWCIGDREPTERVCWPSLYYRNPAQDDLPYARPIDGISIRISLTKKAVIEFNDANFDDFPIPESQDAKSNYYPTSQQRTDLKPIIITQPKGPSFMISNGNQVHWQKWNVHIGFNSREGCTLHGICYNNRPILHKLSMCEMVVPYGDPRPPHCWKNAFDAGEDGLGRNANSLVLGCDCLGHIHYFDAFMITDQGDIRVIKQAICMHEEDASIAWKHTDWRTETAVVARNRKLVISFICTIANYEYGFYYNLFLDGSMEIEVKLTGVLSTGALTELEQISGRKYGINLGSTLYAPVHQHFFVARMDFIVDGINNSIAEWNVETEPEHPEMNPFSNAFYYIHQMLTTEQEAIRDCCSDTARFWQVLNPHIKNSIGSQTSYKLIPQTAVKPYANLKKAQFLKRAQFLEHQLWVTPFQSEERYPGGDFPNQCMTMEGLPKWTQQNRCIEDTDIVIWHVFGVTHCPRPEEWPIMPVEHCGFKLSPFGFFDHSPVMDLPTKVAAGSVLHQETEGVEEAAAAAAAAACCVQTMEHQEEQVAVNNESSCCSSGNDITEKK